MNRAFKRLFITSFIWCLVFLFLLGLLSEHEHASACDIKVTGVILRVEEVDGNGYPVFLLDDIPLNDYINFSVKRCSSYIMFESKSIGNKVELNYSKEYDVLYTNFQVMLYKISKVLIILTALINLYYWVRLIVFAYFFIKLFINNNPSELISLKKRLCHRE